MEQPKSIPVEVILNETPSKEEIPQKELDWRASNLHFLNGLEQRRKMKLRFKKSKEAQ